MHRLDSDAICLNEFLDLIELFKSFFSLESSTELVLDWDIILNNSSCNLRSHGAQYCVSFSCSDVLEDGSRL